MCTYTFWLLMLVSQPGIQFASNTSACLQAAGFEVFQIFLMSCGTYSLVVFTCEERRFGWTMCLFSHCGWHIPYTICPRLVSCIIFFLHAGRVQCVLSCLSLLQMFFLTWFALVGRKKQWTKWWILWMTTRLLRRTLTPSLTFLNFRWVCPISISLWDGHLGSLYTLPLSQLMWHW